MPGRSLTNKWLLFYLLAGYAAGTGLLVLLGFSLPAAILAATAVICPALLIWLYFSPRKGKPKGSHDLRT